jgi:hypothetical protein
LKHWHPKFYEDRCDSWHHSAQLKPCEYGDKDAEKFAVMIGDSILSQWYPAIADYYLAQAWRLIVLSKSFCPMVNWSFSTRGTCVIMRFVKSGEKNR